jgi:heat shock protein HslJ
MGGPARLSGRRLVVGGLITTEMGCDPARQQQDAWLSQFLTSRPTWRLQGMRLTLENRSTRIVLDDRRVAEPDRPLQGTRWVVDTIVDGQSASSVPAGTEASIVFGGNDGFTGSTGCNQMGGSSVVHSPAKTITFANVITTKIACDPDRSRLERAVLSVLNGDVAYRIQGGTLSLDHPSGRGLGLRAAN